MANSRIASLEDRRSSAKYRSVRVFMKNRAAVLGLIIIILLIFGALFAKQIAPHDPNQISAMHRFEAPNTAYWFGTDEYGRDIFSRLLYGAQISLVIAFTSQIVAIFIGISLGLISGWFGGFVDDFVMRLTDAMF